MAFIVKKKIHRSDYYYLRESKREGEKVVSKCLAYLGKNRGEAEKKAKEIIKNLEGNKNNIMKEKSVEKKSESKSTCQPTKISIEDLANFCKAKTNSCFNGKINYEFI